MLIPNPREGDKWGEGEALWKLGGTSSKEGGQGRASTQEDFYMSPLAFPILRTVLTEVRSRVPVLLVFQRCHWNKAKFLTWPDFLGEPGPSPPLPPRLSYFGPFFLLHDAKSFLASKLCTCCSRDALPPNVRCWLLSSNDISLDRFV